ncbi:MAG TPA: hypothetical protein VKB47_09210 [Terracidiphilus sp.]|nr:hypothetical protein [Terracidiphilus sp.]
MTTNFELQPQEGELQKLAEQCWEEAPNRERRLEQEAFEAGEAIRNGDYSLANLEAIVRWKSERLVQYVIANSTTSIHKALDAAATPECTTAESISALLALKGVDLPLATSILAAIHPDKYIELEMGDLEALGQARQDVRFYEAYLTFCRGLVETGIVKPQKNLPGPTPLRALDRALMQWSRNRTL